MVHIIYVLSSLELGQPELDFWAFFIEAKTLRKHAILRKTPLKGKIDWVNRRLATATMEGEKNAYLAYFNELQVELEKWNNAASCWGAK
mgnify:CR=1 FL=1